MSDQNSSKATWDTVKNTDKPKVRSTKADLMEQAFLQWNIIDSIANAVVGWAIVCTYLFWQSPIAEAWSVSGGLFIFLGLIAFADIFGVFLYLTNKIIMKIEKRRKPPFPDLKHLKKLGWFANVFWFFAMFFTAKYSFDMTYGTIRSLIPAQ